MRINYFGIILFFTVHLLQAQDTTHTFERAFKVSFHTKPQLDVKLDNRYSFIRALDVRTIGIKAGLSFNQKFKTGIGFNRMLLSVKSLIKENNKLLAANLKYYYFSPYIEYYYYNSKRWAFDLSAQVGFGQAYLQGLTINGEKIIRKKTWILSYEPAMLIDYKIIRWIGIGTGVGYRIILYKSSGIDQKFSSPEYIFKLKVYLGEIYRTITGKNSPIPAE